MPNSDPPSHRGSNGDRLTAAAGRAARDRDRLRASEADVTSEVIEFQLARQRVGLRSIESLEPLTPRELEVLGLLAAGRSDAEIADELFISKKTASVHVANIKAKLGASSRIEIALLAARLGLVDPSLPGSSAQTGMSDRQNRVICPFKGLASFDVPDAPFFFGRERTVAELVARLAGSTFVGVVGSSGSGKSSVVRAGLVPALADGVLPGSERWAVAIFRPGQTPGAMLDRALASALTPGEGPVAGRSTDDLLETLPHGGRVLLVVDQFEELFTVTTDEAERAAFVRDIVDLARDRAARVLVVIIVRADFYGRCADDREFAERLGANHVLVGPMVADELARAIELPARAARLRVEPELTLALVNDVLDQPGGLPLLSTTLLDLWERRDGRSLRLATYEGIGGVSGAVSRLAERALARLTEDQQRIARAILLRLAAPSEDSDVVVGRPARLSELGAELDPDVAHVVGVLTESRLLTVSEGWVEVAHDALLREWPQLQAWLEEDAEGRRVAARLVRAARDWEQSGEDAAELYRGARLAATLDWSEGRDLEVNEVERRFLAASQSASEREAERQRSSNRRLRMLLGGAVAFLSLALVAGAFGAVQMGRAEREAASANQARELARSRELAASAVATLDEDPALAKLLAVSAASALEVPPPEVAGVLHEALATDRVVHRYEWPAERPVAWTDLHPTDDLVVAVPGLFESGILEVLDADGRRLWSFEPVQGAAVGRAFFTLDGAQVVAGVYRHPEGDAEPSRASLGLFMWDARAGGESRRVDLGPCGAIVTAVSQREAVVRSATEGGCLDPRTGDPRAPIGVVDLASGAHRVISSIAGFGEDRAALTRDGRYLAYDDLGDTPRSVVWDLRMDRSVLEVDLTAPQRQDHSFVRDLSDDGSLLLYGDIPVQVRDVASGDVLASFGGEVGATFFAEFGPDETVVSTGRDATFRQWDPATGRPILVVPAVGSGRPSASNTKRVLVSNAATRSAVVLDIGVRGEIGAVDARAQGVYGADAGTAGACFVGAGSLRAGGDHLLFLDGCSGVLGESTTQVVPVAGTVPRHSLPGAFGQAVAISPDGTRFARQEGSGQQAGPVAIRDLATGDVVLELDGTCRYQNSFQSAEGVGDCASFPEQPFPIWAFQLRWSPDGSMLAAVDQGNGFFVAVWDTSDGSLLTRQRLDPNRDLAAADAIFTPDSDSLIVAYYGGTIQSYSTATWERTTNVKLGVVDGIGLFGFSPDGSTLHMLSGFQGGGSGALHWLDAATLRETRPARERIHDGSPKSMAVSADGSLLATGASDGLIRVWDARTGSLRHEISMGDTEIQGVAFVAADHLAVATRVEGSVLHLTLDVDRLIDIARRSLTRTFSAFECSRYGIDPCPSLEDLRGG